MAKFADLGSLLKSDLSKGLALGIGLAGLGALALPLIARTGRPMLRSAIKTGILLAEVGREALAEASESLEDMVAEVRGELAERYTEAAERAETAAQPPQRPESTD